MARPPETKVEASTELLLYFEPRRRPMIVSLFAYANPPKSSPARCLQQVRAGLVRRYVQALAEHEGAPYLEVVRGWWQEKQAAGFTGTAHAAGAM